MSPEILYEDNHLIVVYKPFGMPSQGDISGDLNVFDWTKQYIKVKYNKPGEVYAALLHRLDRPTGGIISLAKTSKAAARVSKAFQQRKVQKTYYAITERIPKIESGTLIHFLRQIPDKNIMRAFEKEVAGGKRAELLYRVIQKKDGRALIEVKPVTGRKHQIRVQLASIGCTIVGDVKYGKSSFNPDKSICLFAGKLAYEHPVKKSPMEFVAPWPATEPWKSFNL